MTFLIIAMQTNLLHTSLKCKLLTIITLRIINFRLTDKLAGCCITTVTVVVLRLPAISMAKNDLISMMIKAYHVHEACNYNNIIIVFKLDGLN